MSKFMPGAKISSIHGQMRRVADRFVIAMFHPAAALHQAALKPAILKDFSQLPNLLEQARAALKRSTPLQVAEETKEEPRQLNLF
jgi:DNA polymerase